MAGLYRDVLIQCFERRCMTYTPGNSPGFEAETGNVGLHYHTWRTVEIPAEATPTAAVAVVIEAPSGPIWNAIPREFLLFAGAEPIEIREPVSAALEHPAEAASPADIVNGYRDALVADGWQVVVAGPLEDGSMVVDARDGSVCRAQVRAMPIGGVVRITVLYGAGCPRP